MEPLRAYLSDPAISSEFTQIIAPIHAQSEPALFFSHLSTKKHPLLNQEDFSIPHSYHEYLFAADTLENIVNEGALVGTILTKFKWFNGPKESGHVSKDMSDRVLKLVYGTMKYLPYIDTILVKTQFLVFNNQFLDSLGLVKVMLFDLMKHHFNLKTFPGISYEIGHSLSESDLKYQTYCVQLVKDLEETMESFQVKLGAAYARLRIERQATGDNPFEQMNNVLPESVRVKESMAMDMPKTLRVNGLKTTRRDVALKLAGAGYRVELQKKADLLHYAASDFETLIYLDHDFDDLLVVPSSIFSDIKASSIVKEGLLIFQDKASMYCLAQIKGMLKNGETVIDSRAGCGTKLAHLSELVGKKGRVIAFEHRPARLETLRLNLELYGCKNVEIIEDEFLSSDFRAQVYSDVSSIVVEPINSGTTVIDKLSYMLQEEEYPVDHLTLKDLYTLKRQQTAILKHAFKFPKISNILYITRSIHSEENEMVVRDVLDRHGVEWKLACVLPDIPSDQNSGGEFDIEECLTVHPSEKSGNGIFVANFQLKPLVIPIHRQEDPAALAKRLADLASIAQLEQNEVPNQLKRKKQQKPKGRKKGEPLKIKLPKGLRASVERLSIPRLFSANSSKKKREQDADEIIIDKKGGEDGDEERAGLEQQESLKKIEAEDEGRTIDIGVFGVSIQKFFNPRQHALDILKQQQSSFQQFQKPRWIYPVPNPITFRP